MSKLLFDFLPIMLFFIAFKLFDIYIATGVAIAASALQLLLHWYKHKRFEKMHVITFIMIAVLGSATLLLHNELFIKWKPTAINWVFALLFAGSHIFAKRPFIAHLLAKQITLPDAIWTRLNLLWIVFFTAIGAINLFVVYHFDTQTWVNFKLFGMLGLTFVFVLLQSLYLSRHMDPAQSPKA